MKGRVWTFEVIVSADEDEVEELLAVDLGADDFSRAALRLSDDLGGLAVEIEMVGEVKR